MGAELLNLPWQIQVSLASGYTAYMIAYVGIREGHGAIDTTFITLAFGLVATSVLWLLADNPVYIAAIAAFTLSSAFAVLWRKWGIDAARWYFRRADISWGNDDPSAFATLTRSTEYYTTQVAVLLDDGTWLICDDTRRFADAPFGPCIVGPNGDIGLYLTHEERAGSFAKELTSVRDKDFGDRITYIPASKIKRITLRHKR